MFLDPFTIIVAKQSWRQDAVYAFLPLDMPYASIIANFLQSEEEEDELVRDEEATKHEIVQDKIKKKFQMNGSGWASHVFFNTWRNWEM